MNVRAGRPAFDWPYAGVHRSTSLTISSLLLQQCPACIGTELLYIGSSCLCSSMWRGPQEYITYEFVPSSTLVSRMSGSSNFDSLRGGWSVDVQLLLRVFTASRTCSILQIIIYIFNFKYNLYYYSSTATFVWSRNAVRESSYISFFRGGEPLCEFERRPENTHDGAYRFAWVTSGFLSQFKITDLILSFNSYAEIWTRLFAYTFSVYGWLSELTTLFIPVICWSYLWTELSVTLSTDNKLYCVVAVKLFLHTLS